MSHAPSFFESLEDRSLMSVSAATLAGPLTVKGTQWTYQLTQSGKLQGTQTEKVVGTSTVGKVKTTQLTTTGTVSGAAINSTQYVALDSKLGLAGYKLVSSLKQGPLTVNTTDTYSSPGNATIFPASLTGGKTYSFKWTDTAVSQISPGGFTQTTKENVAYTVKLVSEKTSKLTVPAGTFSVYTIQTTTKITVNGKTSSANSTLYVAPGVGLIETISGSSKSVLTKFAKGK